MVRAAMVTPFLGLAACGGGYSPNYDLLAKGPSAEFSGAALKAAAQNQKEVVEQLSIMAGLKGREPEGPTEWKLFGIAALGRARLECNAYITEIMKVEEHRRTINQQLGLTGAATAGILGVSGVASAAIAITAIAFGLAQGTVDNVTTGLLYSLGAEPVQALIANLRGAYTDKLTDASWHDRPTTFNTIYGYLELCTPVVLREKIKIAVATAQAQASDVDKQGGPPRVSLATQRIIEKQVVTEPAKPLPPTPPAQRIAGNLDPDEQTVTAAYVQNLQRALCVPNVTGDMGGLPGSNSPTRLAIKQFHSGWAQIHGKQADIVIPPEAQPDKIRPDQHMSDLDAAVAAARLEKAQRCRDRGFLANAFEVGLWGDKAKAQRATEFRQLLGVMRQALGLPPVNPTGDAELEAATRDAITALRAENKWNLPGPNGFDFAFFRKLSTVN
jgi:hypothetical protein